MGVRGGGGWGWSNRPNSTHESKLIIRLYQTVIKNTGTLLGHTLPFKDEILLKTK